MVGSSVDVTDPGLHRGPGPLTLVRCQFCNITYSQAQLAPVTKACPSNPVPRGGGGGEVH